MNLKNKVVVITGGSKGLGYALAEELKARGAHIVICAHHNELAAAAKKVGVIGRKTDVTKELEVRRLAQFVIKKFGRIDIWINNAGIWAPWADIVDLKIDKIRAMLEVNIIGTINGSKEALRQMRKQKSGTIINVISTSGLVARPRSAGYAASKWGAKGFTESLRAAVKGEHISVIDINPNGFQSEIFGIHKPKEYSSYMTSAYVASKTIANLLRAKPKKTLIIGE